MMEVFNVSTLQRSLYGTSVQETQCLVKKLSNNNLKNYYNHGKVALPKPFYCVKTKPLLKYPLRHKVGNSKYIPYSTTIVFKTVVQNPMMIVTREINFKKIRTHF